MFIFTFHLGWELHNRLSRSGAWAAITTVNGISTRSGFRDKKGDFLIKCIHHSGFSVLLALSETLLTAEKCESHWGRKREKPTLSKPALKYSVISKNALHLSEMWGERTVCKRFHCSVLSLHQAPLMSCDRGIKSREVTGTEWSLDVGWLQWHEGARTPITPGPDIHPVWWDIIRGPVHSADVLWPTTVSQWNRVHTLVCLGPPPQ